MTVGETFLSYMFMFLLSVTYDVYLVINDYVFMPYLKYASLFVSYCFWLKRYDCHCFIFHPYSV